MALKEIVQGIYAIPLGMVNAFLIDSEGDLILIDTGATGSEEKIFKAVRELDREPRHIQHILVTHCHGDHSGSLAAIKQATGAPAYMHMADAALVRTGRSMRPMRPSPGLLSHLLYWLFIRPAPATIAPADIEFEVLDGEELPIAGGLRAIHAPGHCAGQLVFLWPQQGGVLFAADVASNIRSLRLSLAYEDLAEGKRTLAKIAALQFQTACFGHGGAIIGGAAAQFRRRFEL